MNGAEFLLRSIAADGTDHVFMMPGGLVDPFSTALANVPADTPIVAAQEGGAAYAADGYARASGKFGACLVIGGPGLTNTVTAMSAALTDRVPLLLVSGEVATFVEGVGFFQDASAGTFDDTAELRPVTAESFSIPDAPAAPLIRRSDPQDVRRRASTRPPLAPQGRPEATRCPS